MLHTMIVHMHKPNTRAGRLAQCGLATYQLGGVLLAALVILACLVGIPVLGSTGTHEALVRGGGGGCTGAEQARPTPLC